MGDAAFLFEHRPLRILVNRVLQVREVGPQVYILPRGGEVHGWPAFFDILSTQHRVDTFVYGGAH